MFAQYLLNGAYTPFRRLSAASKMITGCSGSLALFEHRLLRRQPKAQSKVFHDVVHLSIHGDY